MTPAEAPDTVQVGPHRITVKIDEAAHNASQAAEGQHLFGRYDPATNVVTIAPGLQADAEADTLLHELLHAIIAATGLTAVDGPLEESSASEAVIAALTPAMIDLLRRNRALVEYLLG
jgi:hypothetical protein